MSRNVEVHLLREYTGHTGSVFALLADAEERYLYSSGDDGIVACWDLQDPGDTATALMRAERSIYSMALLPEHGLLAAGSSDGSVYMISLVQRKLIHTFRKTSEAVYGLHYDAGREILWALQGRGGMSAIRIPEMKEEGWLRLSQEHLRCIQLDAGRQLLYIGASDQHILVFDPAKGEVTDRWVAHDNSVFSLLYDPSRDRLLSGGRDAHLKAWDIGHGHQLLASLPAHLFTLNDIKASPDGHYFLTASRDKTLKLWDADTFELLKVIDAARNQGHRHSVNKIAWLTSDNSVISCSDDRRLIRWKLQVEH